MTWLRRIRLCVLAVWLGANLWTPASARVVISEFLASNATGLLDSDRHAVDWIELHNDGTEEVALDGWFLTDSRGNPTKWRFPDVHLAPDNYLVVFASGKDRTNALFALHTNFKLSAGGEYLGLIGPDGVTVMSEFAPSYPPQAPDLSMGWAATSDGGGLRFFSPPTPGQPNGEGSGPEAVAPLISQGSGTFVDPFAVTLTATPAGAALHFTTDGSVPTTNSARYAEPVRIERTSVLRVRAFVPGLSPSPVVGAAYTRLGASAVAFQSDLPLVVVNTFGRVLSESTRNPVYVAVHEPDASTHRTTLAGAGVVESRGGMEIRGSSSAGFEKKSYGLELQNEAGLDRPRPLLGLPEDSDWVLYAPYTDKSLIRDVLAYELSRRIGRYAPRTRFVELFVNRGNTDLDSSDYQGVYVLIEKMKIADERVAVDGMEPDDLAEPEISGGYLLKRDRFDANDQVFSTSRGVELGIEDPKRSQIGTVQRNWIRTWLGQMERTLYGTAWRDPVEGYVKYLDPDSFIDHQLLVESAKNIDGYRLSTYWHKERSGRLKMGPIWDYNLTFGNANYLDGWKTNGWYWQSVGDPGYTWLTRLFQDPDFRQRYADRWFEHRAGPFAPNALTGLIDDLAGQVREAQVRNFNRWRIMGQYVWPNWFIASSWAQEITWLKGWATQRAAWMDSQFIAPPSGSHAGGSIPDGVTLTLTPRRGTLYYTVDGTDPRQRGGAVAATASGYTGPIRLEHNAHVFARSRSGTNWSAPFDATFIVRMPTLAITEVMYRPARQDIGPSVDPAGREFIELRNVGDRDEPLAGVRLEGTVSFRFPENAGVLLPGEHIVVVRRRSDWESPAFRIAGDFTGTLHDDAGTITLMGPMGERIQTLNYSAEWYRQTDGGGYSLTVARENAEAATFSLPSNWRASLVPGGTPGRPNILDRGAPTLTALRSDAAGFQLTFQGTPGVAYSLQVSADPAKAEWKTVRDVVAGGASPMVLTDPAPPGDEPRFYRLVTPRQ